MKTKRILICIIVIFCIFYIGRKTLQYFQVKEYSQKVDKIELVQVKHPYLGGKVNSIFIEKSDIYNILKDLDPVENEPVKFYSCYVLKIYEKNGVIKKYRTNGIYFEPLIETSETKATAFKSSQNLVTKYWKIPPELFCKTIFDLIQGKWYLNKWTLYHTLDFGKETLIVDNHIDSVFYLKYKIQGDTLLIWDGEHKKNNLSKIQLINKDSITLYDFPYLGNKISYTRTKRQTITPSI